jgi:hypothetical protein
MTMAIKPSMAFSANHLPQSCQQSSQIKLINQAVTNPYCKPSQASV